MLEETLPSIWASMHSWCTPTTVLFVLINVVIGTIYFSSAGHKPEEDENRKYPPLLRRTSSVLERFRSFNLYRQNTQELPPLNTTLDPQPLRTVETLGLGEPGRSTGPASGTDLTGDKRQEESDPRPEEILEASEFEEAVHYSRRQSDTRPTAVEGDKRPEDSDPRPEETLEASEFEEAVHYSRSQSDTRPTVVERLEKLEKLAEKMNPLPEGTIEESEFEEAAHYSRSQSDTHPTPVERLEKPAQRMKKSASSKSAFGHFQEEEIVEAMQRPATMRERKVVGEDEEVDAKADDFINRFKQDLKLQRLNSISRCNEMRTRGK